MEKEKLIQTVQLAQCGSSSALNELFNAYYNDVYYFALKTVKDTDLACEITQETFVEIINTLGKLKEPAAFVTWMKQITYHQCTRYFKKKKEVLVDEDEEGNTIFDIMTEERTEFIPDEAVDQADFRATILAMIDQLSDEQRAATMMYYFDEMSVRDIAKAQGVGENTVKGRLRYAKQALRQSVEEYEKKNNIKLHSLGILPLLLWLYQGFGKSMPVAAAHGMAKGVSAATGTSISVAAETAAGATTATTVMGTGAAATGIGAKLAALPMAVKVASVAVAASMVVVPVVWGIAASKEQQPNSMLGQSISTSPTFPSTYDDHAPIIRPTEENPSLPTDENPILPPEDETEDLYYVPAGCTYTSVTGKVFHAGEPVTVTCSIGDTFNDGEYSYQYSRGMLFWKGNSWIATVLDQNKTSYAPVAGSINGKALTVMYRTYEKCTALRTAPAIPEGVTEMNYTFSQCSTLENAPVLPKSLKKMEYTFSNCVALQVAPTIPDGVESMYCTFNWCRSLEAAPAIPDSVTNMNSTFFGCDKLTQASAFPSNVLDISSAYSGTAITIAPEIPKSVLYASLAFFGTKITTAPVIPANVICACNIFSGCWNLTGEVIINAQLVSGHTIANGLSCLNNAYELFSGCQLPIVLSGECQQLDQVAALYDKATVK